VIWAASTKDKIQSTFCNFAGRTNRLR
jgi:hypothetical protein